MMGGIIIRFYETVPGIMKRNILTALLLLFMALPLFPGGQDTAGQDRPVFTVIPINRLNSTEFKASMIIKKHLEGFMINDSFRVTKSINFNNCIAAQCIEDLADIAGKGIVILITVTSENVKIDEKQLTRYLTEDIIERRYTVHVITSDLGRAGYDLRFSETVNDPSEILKAVDAIGRRIREYYSMNKNGI